MNVPQILTLDLIVDVCRNRLVYLSCCTKHEVAELEYRKFVQACQIVGELTTEGLHVICPLVMNVPVDSACKFMGLHVKNTRENNLFMLERSDVLLISTKIAGWDTSEEVKEHIRLAEFRQIPVLYLG